MDLYELILSGINKLKKVNASEIKVVVCNSDIEITLKNNCDRQDRKDDKKFIMYFAGAPEEYRENIFSAYSLILNDEEKNYEKTVVFHDGVSIIFEKIEE